MKKIFKLSSIAVLAIATSALFTSCDNEGGRTDSQELDSAKMTKVFENYTMNTVIPTYRSLADASIELEKACTAIYEHSKTKAITDADMKAAADAWKNARKFWERSEAFLLGPAGDLGIDPHIDTWPLDKATLEAMFADPQIMESVDADYITKHYGAGGMCGFHAIEYVLFEEGNVKAASKIDDLYAKYLWAVSGDLKLHCFALEGAWAGLENIDKAKRDFLKEKDFFHDHYDTPIMNFKDHFLNAGASDPIYKTQLEAMIDAVQGEGGCFGIANEVGTAKIHDPQESKNPLDVESWYSFNSITDFQDNIRGIKMVIMDGGENSIYNFIKAENAELAEKLAKSIDKTIGEDGTTGIGAMPAPFRNHLGNPKNNDAMDACNELATILQEVATFFEENYL